MSKNAAALYFVNGLTVTRLLLAGFIPVSSPTVRLAVVVVALLTEFFDGFLARRWGVPSKFGRLLDPVADKIFVGTLLVVLLLEQRIDPLQLVLLLSRDWMVLLCLGVYGLTQRQLPLGNVRPRWAGKIATTFQFLVLMNLTLALAGVGTFSSTLFALAVASSVISALDYFWFGVHGGLSCGDGGGGPRGGSTAAPKFAGAS